MQISAVIAKGAIVGGPLPWVMTALTVPLPLLVMGAIGVVIAALRARVRRSTDDLLLLLMLLPIALIDVPDTPIFGEVKH